MAVKKNLYQFVGVSELASKRELKGKYRMFLRDKEKKYKGKGRSQEESEEYVLKKNAWAYLLNPEKKAEMDQLIEEYATPQRLAERNKEISKRKTANLLIIIAFVSSILVVIPTGEPIWMIGLLIPMILLYFLPFGYTKFTSLLPYIVGVLAWVICAAVQNPFFIVGVATVIIYWFGNNLHMNRGGDNIWTPIQ